MPVTFKNPSQRNAYNAVVRELRALGYADDLLIEDYRFGDWFVNDVPERTIPAAAFGQTPISYDSALFGVALTNGLSGKELAVQYRALGAPIVFEVSDDMVREWAIGRDEQTIAKISEIPATGIGNRFAEQAAEWAPAHFLRAKNIGDFRWNRQLEFFADVLPELEIHIQAKLSPMLRDAMASASAEYRKSAGQEPDPEKLFKLIFWLLTGKVFRDRDIHGFRNIEEADGADAILAAVAKHYKQESPHLLNKKTRELALSRIWSSINFRNLSVDVLAQIWSTSLVTENVKKQLGIHRTPRSVAKYLVDQIEFDNADDEHKTVLEPCCGSAVFLIAAMNRLRSLQWGLSSRARHRYFTQHLVGYEVDPFGVEISRLALTLADFPNPNGWQIRSADVFGSGNAFPKSLRTAGVVLCNPPFEAFTEDDRKRYSLPATRKPIELLRRVLTHLHPRGVLGFVLPKNIVDGREYKDIRRKLAERFASIEITSLPDQAFEADHEVALLVAQRPIPHLAAVVRHRQVIDTPDDWRRFEGRHQVTSEEEADKSIDECITSFAVPQLSEIWAYLENNDRLRKIAELHRGIEWNLPLTVKDKDRRTIETGNREKLISPVPKPGFSVGVPPEADVYCFTTPELKYLDTRPQHQRGNAYRLPWHLPKVILNAVTKSRRGWRIAAFADQHGIVGYQNITGVWADSYDLVALAAVLNAPVANAYVTTREGKRHVTIETLRDIPLPRLTESQISEIHDLVRQYQGQVSFGDPWAQLQVRQVDLLLKKIDAVVLAAYDLPPRLERKLLDFFNDQSRGVPFGFTNYFPADFEPYFSLADYLSKGFSKRTGEKLQERFVAPTDDVIKALAFAAGQDDE